MDDTGNAGNTITTTGGITITGTGPCPGCDGRGWQQTFQGIRVWCPMCYGTGKIKMPIHIPPIYVPSWPDTPYPWYPWTEIVSNPPTWTITCSDNSFFQAVHDAGFFQNKKDPNWKPPV